MQEQDTRNPAPPEDAPPVSSGNENGNSAEASAIAALEAQVKEKEAKYLYLYADFENFRKRAERERLEAQKFGWKNIAAELLQVLDNLERGLAHAPASTDSNLMQGLQMVQKLFQATLEKHGVQPVSTVGQPFDPNVHEAVGQDFSDQPEGTVIREEQKGYTLQGRLLRPARVLISKGRGSP